MTPRIKDLAKALALSPATVSRALNGFPEVSEKTRRRVQQAALELGYQPHLLARKLVGGRSGIVALVVPDASAMGDDTSFFGVLAALSAALAARDMDLMVHVNAGGDVVEPYRRLLAKGVVDGFIVNGPRQHDPRIAFLRDAGVPFVVHGRSGATDDFAYFDIDNHAVSAEAVTLLWQLGHRVLALINGPADLAYARDRHAGFVETLQSLGVPARQGLVFSGDETEAHGYLSALAALRMQGDGAPSAFLCATTSIAAGVLRALSDMGLRVPQDVSVIAHDDHLPRYRAAEMTPPLTVTDAPLTAACQPLVELLVAELEGEPGEVRQIRQRAELVMRKSVAVAAGMRPTG